MAGRRLALLLAALLSLAPAAARLRRPAPAPPRACAPEGRGRPPRHFVGCAADPGPRRDLDGLERLALGLPLDPNRAAAAELARVPGFSPRLAEALVADRAARGPFASVEDLVRVRGIGPGRLARARPHLRVEAGAPLGDADSRAPAR
jgi:competence protein ComEA